MMAAAMTLEGLEGLVLETILSKLSPRDAAAVACASTRLRAVASDDALWHRFCARDFDLGDAPVGPDGTTCISFKESYRRWLESFGMYSLPLVRRVKQCWSTLRSWLAVNFPEANETLRKGASEDEISMVEENLGVKLPAPTRILYRLCDGQQTLSEERTEYERLSPLGIIGGYEFYNHIANVHLLPLEHVVSQTKAFARKLGFFTRSKYIMVATSYIARKFFFLDCADGQLYVGTRNLVDGEMMPCVPQVLLRPTTGSSHDMSQDAFLLWLEEHSRRLQSGMIRARQTRIGRSICLFPEAPPSCSAAVTNGIQVRASAVFVPEATDLKGREDKYIYAYSIRMSLLPEGCRLNGMHYNSCQLHSRHWIIRSGENIVSDVTGEAVIGKFPLLFPNKEEFVYQSCTPLPAAPGSVEGSFTFVPGRLTESEGPQFDVKVAPFVLEEPMYIF